MPMNTAKVKLYPGVLLNMEQPQEAKKQQTKIDIPPGYVTAMELAELAEIKAEKVRRRCRAAGVKELKVEYGEHRKSNRPKRYCYVYEQRAAMYAVLEK